MNKLVDSAVFKSDFAHQKALSGNKAYWSDSYERRLRALFEAIIAEDIAHRPSPDDAKSAK